MKDTRKVSVSCLCGLATHTFIVPLTSLPLSSHLCNCTTSRRISGTLFTSYINISHSLPYSPNPQKPDLSALIGYESSERLTRWFCGTCGTHMYLEYAADRHFEAATGTLRLADGERMEEIVEYKSYMWIEDTRDGGASLFNTHVGDKLLDRHLQGPESTEISLDWRYETSSPEYTTKPEIIHATCHCAGVEFYVTPPNDASKTASSPYPDLLIPYHHGPDASKNPDNYAWWLAGPKHDRYLAGTCACTICRRALGFDITFWAFIPAVNIFLDAKCTLPFSRSKDGKIRKYWGTIQTYRSSPNVTRSFCGKCGANIFWDGDERPNLIDVSVGLLDAKSGVRAEDILAWWPGRVSFNEDATNKGLIRGLEDGLRRWAEKNEGEDFVAVGKYCGE